MMLKEVELQLVLLLEWWMRGQGRRKEEQAQLEMVALLQLETEEIYQDLESPQILDCSQCGCLDIWETENCCH